MTRFQHCLRIVLKNEGGYVNHKADRGGATNMGITQRVYSDFCKVTGRPDKDVKNITMDEVEAIYAGYWKDAHCSYLPEPLDLQMFDFAVNSGATRAKKMLQRVLGVDEDGVIGRQTLDALHEEVIAAGAESVANALLDERARFFDRIIERDPTQAAFAKGWMRRIDHMREFA